VLTCHRGHHSAVVIVDMNSFDTSVKYKFYVLNSTNPAPTGRPMWVDCLLRKLPWIQSGWGVVSHGVTYSAVQVCLLFTQFTVSAKEPKVPMQYDWHNCGVHGIYMPHHFISIYQEYTASIAHKACLPAQKHLGDLTQANLAKY
jgi:hypothetical protein